jgi:hypothetical protein
LLGNSISKTIYVLAAKTCAEYRPVKHYKTTTPTTDDKKLRIWWALQEISSCSTVTPEPTLGFNS